MASNSPSILPPFDANALLESARAIYIREDDILCIDQRDAADARVYKLPFVNRVEQLVLAADALLQNVQLALSKGDSRRYKLVFCAQLFGAGKTSFAERLAQGLEKAYGGKLVYARLEGIPTDSGSLEKAVARMVIDAAEQREVISITEAESLRSGSCVMSSILLFLEKRLVSNSMRLFIHMDEFDLSCSALVAAYPMLRELSPNDRYNHIWRCSLMPLLRSPNLHLIVTGRVPELAILGTLGTTATPCTSYHALLGSLDTAHIAAILRHLTVKTSSGETIPLFLALGLPDLGPGGRFDASDPWALLLAELRRISTGIPRFLCLALGELLRLRYATGSSLASFRIWDAKTASALFAPDSLLCQRLALSPFVSGPINLLNNMMSLKSNSTQLAEDLQALLMHVFTSRSERLDSDAGRDLLRMADTFGAYTDPLPAPAGDDSPTPTHIRAILPGILLNSLRSRNVLDFITRNLPKVISFRPPPASAGAVGEDLEAAVDQAMDFHWVLSELESKAIPALHALLSVSDRLRDYDVVLGLQVIRVDMGKMLNAGEISMAVNNRIPAIFSTCNVASESNVMFTPRPQSHAPDRMFSLTVRPVLRAPAACIAAIPAVAPPCERALVLFAMKHVVRGSLSRVVLGDEIRKIADTVYSLPTAARKLYGRRIVLYIIAHPSANAPLADVLSTDELLFPTTSATGKVLRGTMNAREVKFNNLGFDVVLVPESVLTDFFVIRRR